MIDRAHRLPVKKQCELLEVNRSSIYYLAKGPSEADLALARRIDQIHLARPFLGSRRIQDQLDREGVRVNPQEDSALDAPDGASYGVSKASDQPAWARA